MELTVSRYYEITCRWWNYSYHSWIVL